MRLFVYFGQNGWPIKFKEIIEYLAENREGYKVRGLTSSVRSYKTLLSMQAKNFQLDKIEDSSILSKNFLNLQVTDKELELMERSYGLSLWSIIYPERRYIVHQYSRKYIWKRYSSDELKRISYWIMRYFERELDGIDLVLLQNPASAWAYALCIVAQKKGIPVRAIRSLAHPNERSIWHENAFENWISVNEDFLAIKSGKLKCENLKTISIENINNFRESIVKPPWLIQARKQEQLKSVVSFEGLRYTIRFFTDKSYSSCQHILNFYINLTQRLKFKLLKNFFRLSRKFIFEFPKFEEKYSYFALHVEPEAALSINGKGFRNQISLIEHIASSLPIGTKLYVKEHPTMLGWRNLSYYKKLSNIPNVRLISPEVSSIKLVETALCVFTINGTVGFEAALKKIPVVTFGNAFYNSLSTVITCNNVDKIFDCYIEAIDTPKSEQELIAFMMALYKNSFSLPYQYHWGLGDNDIEAILELKDISKHCAESLKSSLEGTELPW